MKITFHRFNLPETEDPDVWVAEPIYDWQQTDQGRWVMQHAHNITYHQQPDANFWGYDIVIRGDLIDPKSITEYFLRWPETTR